MSIIGFEQNSPASRAPIETGPPQIVRSPAASRAKNGAPTKTERPLIVRLFNILGILYLVAGVIVAVFSLGAFNPTWFIAGVAGVFLGILFLGLAEFFEQIARIALATEETVRELREQSVQHARERLVLENQISRGKEQP